MIRPLIALLLLPVLSTAQNLQLGLNAGIDNPLIPKSPFISAKVISGYKKHLMFGGGLDLSIHREDLTLGSEGTNGKVRKFNFTFTDIFVYPHVFAHYKYSIGRAQLYIGPSVGWYYINYSIAVPVGRENPPALEQSRESDIGFAWGMHLGTTVRITKKIGINAEACRRVAWVSGGKQGHLPVSVGIRYTL